MTSWDPFQLKLFYDSSTCKCRNRKLASRHKVEYNALEPHFPLIPGPNRFHTKTGSYMQILGDFSPHLQEYLGKKLPLTSVGLVLLCTCEEAGPSILHKLLDSRPINKAQRHQFHQFQCHEFRLLSHLEQKTPQTTQLWDVWKDCNCHSTLFTEDGLNPLEGILIAYLQKLTSYVWLHCTCTL